MSTTTHVKLGLLALVAGAAATVAALGLGIHAMRASTVEYHTYFDESVQGLELGAAVKYRGVRIGRVAEIAIAPDQKHVDVLLALLTSQAAQLGLAETTPELRAQLASQGITGVKFVDIDFFDTKANPPPALPFQVDLHYIPARPSLIEGLEANLEALGPRLPQLADRIDGTLAKMSRVLDDVSDERIAKRFADAADSAGAAANELRGLVRRLAGARLDEKTAVALDRAGAAAGRLDELVARLDGLTGLVASAKRATDSFGDLGHATLGSSDELERTLRELGEAARSVHELADAIERDPDVLVKGRARSGKR